MTAAEFRPGLDRLGTPEEMLAMIRELHQELRLRVGPCSEVRCELWRHHFGGHRVRPLV